MFKKLRSNKPVLLALLIVLLPIVGITGYMVVDPEPESESGTGTELVQVVTATETTPEATATAISPTQTATETPATATTIPPTQVVTETPASPTATQADEASSTIRKIIERGYLIAGVKCDFYPMGYIQDPKKEPSSNRWENKERCDPDIKHDYKNDQRAGFEIELMKEFAKRWLGNESAVTFTTVVSPTDNIMKLTEGEVDLVAAIMTHTKERDKDISFSQTYFYDGQGLLVKDPNINSLKDLVGKSVTVLKGTTSSKNIKTEAERLGVRIEVREASDEEGLELLLSGDVDAYTTDSVRLIHLSDENPSLRFVKKQFSEEAYQFSEEPYGMGVSKGDAEFRDLVNFTLQEMKLDGTYKRIYASWFGDEIYDLETWPGPSYLNVNLTPMLRIEAGTFTLGSEATNTERTVSLEAFSIDQYEVTNRLYKECVNEDNEDRKCIAPDRNINEQYGDSDKENHPVTGITFEQAKEYCAYVNKRLPTEDEWEAAARGGDELSYPWGNQPPDDERANFDNVNGGTMEVIWDKSSHEKHVSPDGLHHMAGNVREWVQPLESGQEVTRGGGWKDKAEDIRTTARVVGVNMVADDVGFRCAVKADEFPSPSP